MLFCLKFVECGECGRDVSVLVEAYASEEASFSTIMALQKGLCPSSDLDLETEDDVKECQQFMEDFMPIALRQIADYVIGNRRKFCNELFDVCTLDQTNEVRNSILFIKYGNCSWVRFDSLNSKNYISLLRKSTNSYQRSVFIAVCQWTTCVDHLNTSLIRR